MPRLRRILFGMTLALIAGGGSGSAWGVITLTGDFDEGSLKSYAVNGSTISLVGRDTYAGSGHFLGGGAWRWLYFKASGVQDQRPTFTVSRDFGGDRTPGPHELTDHEMVYSYDGETWQFFDSNALGASNFTFSNFRAFTQDDVYVAYALPYTYGQSVAHAQSVLATPWAMPTASGDVNGVIGQSPAGTDELGRSIPALDLYAYRVSNPATDGSPKRRALLTTGQHAGETLGVRTMEGLVDWLVSDDPRAAALRDRAEFFVYPLLNASGRYAGLSRAMLDSPNSDSNGFWSPTRWQDRPEQRTLGEAMLADVNPTGTSTLDLAIDFHSSVPDYEIAGPNGEGTGGRDDWGYVKTNQGDHLDPFWLALRALQPNVLEVSSGGGSNTTIGFAENYLNADIDITFENQFAISRPASYYSDLGANFGLAMYQAWVQVAAPLAGDFDEDGEVDAADLAAWQAGFGLTGAEHWQGDANSDGAVRGGDFLAWQQQAGQSSAAAAVPEPSGLLASLLVAASLLAVRLRLVWSACLPTIVAAGHRSARRFPHSSSLPDDLAMSTLPLMGRAFAAAMFLAAPVMAQHTHPPMAAEIVAVERIWDAAPHCAFTDLLRWRDRWYCGFREGQRHVGDQGRLRIIASDDGQAWKSVALLELADFDLRDAALSITPEGRLMVLGGARQLGVPRPATGTFACFSDDGREFSPPKIVISPGRWLWRVTWHEGVAYGVSYSTPAPPAATALLTTPDGRAFSERVPELLAQGRPTEGVIRFAADGTAVCLQRRDGAPADRSAFLGVAAPPYDTWQWSDLGCFLGGPNLIATPAGQWLAAGRTLDGDGAHTTLGVVELDTKSFAPLVRLPSGGDTSYPGLAWHDGLLWMSYYSSHEAGTCVYLAKLRITE